jgi:hypothetical protein
MPWKDKNSRLREARAAREQQRRAERLREAAEVLRDLVESVERDAKREPKPGPGHGGDLWRFLRRIAQGDLCLWAVVDVAGLTDPNKFDWLHAMVAKAVAAHLTWTAPRTARRRRELEKSGY